MIDTEKQKQICAETTKSLLLVKLIQERLQNFHYGLAHIKEIKNKLQEISDRL